MHSRTLRLFVLLSCTFVLLLTAAIMTFGATVAFGATLSPIQQSSVPANTPLGPDALEQYWQEMYPPASFGIRSASNVYTHELLAKAAPDECFNGLGAGVTFALPDCPGGQPKVNEAYVWGLTDYQDSMWFGTAPNVHCLVMGGFLGSTSPITTNSYVCEFGLGPYSTTLPALIGDWRPPSAYVYDITADALTEVTPNGQGGRPFDPRLIRTLGIRSAATLGDYVFLAGPALTPTASINIFLFNAATQSYVGSVNKPEYNNIRKWLEVDGVLYAGVGKGTEGAVLRYVGNPADPATRWDFVEVGTLDADAAELALHDGRIFVNTWPNGFAGGDVAGLYMSPPIPAGGFSAPPVAWEKVFAYDQYEPDPLIARTYGGGALHSFEGELYWGTMHVPFLATLAHMANYSDDYSLADPSRPDQLDFLNAMFGSQRSVTIFKGDNFGTPEEQVQVAYGMEQLPAFDPISLTWSLTDTLIGPPLYGAAGFDNMYNNYTWSMAEYDGQLFVGTMDWSFLIQDFIDLYMGLIDTLFGGELPLDIDITLPDAVSGADLFRFYDNSQPAIAESRSGVGNYTSYGVRNLLGREDGLYLGMANPMNLLTDLTDDKPEGGWELLRLTRHLIPLAVGLGGNGSGAVVSSLPGINCGISCTTSYDIGTTVVLTPQAATGSTFTGWSNVCFGLGNCAVTLAQPTSLVANFSLNTHTLAVALAGDGSGSVVSNPVGINCGTACDKSFDFGTAVTLTPSAAAGSLFAGWSGACSGTGACNVSITESRQVTATFADNRFPLVVNIIGGGSGYVSSLPAGLTCSQPTCSADFDNGTVVSLSAIAFSGSSFESWGGACSGSGACTVTIGPGTTVVNVSFGQNPSDASLQVSGEPLINSTLTFTALLNLNPITACTWDFGDGTTEACDLPATAAGVDATDDVEVTTTHVYTQPGVYIVIVSASNNAGTAMAAQQLVIQVPTAEEPTEQPNQLLDLFFPYVNRE
jgi:hypothetical protein